MMCKSMFALALAHVNLRQPYILICRLEMKLLKSVAILYESIADTISSNAWII